MSDLENRIAALEAKIGLHDPPPLQFRMVFVDPASHEVVAITWMERDGDPRDGGPGRRWFEREPNESESDFLARVENSTQKQEA